VYHRCVSLSGGKAPDYGGQHVNEAFQRKLAEREGHNHPLPKQLKRLHIISAEWACVFLGVYLDDGPIWDGAVRGVKNKQGSST
jgi:hypothetical protein